jgi:ketosteroid isomerase-like protein
VHGGELLDNQMANVLVVRVRDGLIVRSRDFHDHHALAKALAA